MTLLLTRRHNSLPSTSMLGYVVAMAQLCSACDGDGSSFFALLWVSWWGGLIATLVILKRRGELALSVLVLTLVAWPSAFLYVHNRKKAREAEEGLSLRDSDEA